MAVEILAAHIPATGGAAALAQVRAEHAALYAATEPVTQPHPASLPASELTGAAVRSLDPHQVKSGTRLGPPAGHGDAGPQAVPPHLGHELGHVRAEEDAHRITPAEAAAERIGLLERHLELCQQARLDHLGGTP